MSNIEKANLETFAKQAFLAYAMSVVRGRAIPSVEDGLKPVQRRVLYAMNVLKITDTSKPMKCARVVGDVIGKYHPHGDSAVYEAMVRMAQKHQLRYPLVDGHGNFGSRDGDNAAAMRYTEARLTPIASALLDELSHDTVDYRPNYDNSMQEPVTLPARLPFLLLNGASGIGVGLATDLLPHNLGEVVEAAKLLLMKPKTKLEEFMAVVPGPDFPTGGKLISSPDDIRKIYEEGNGTLRLRAQWRVEESGKRWKLIFHELPQPTNSEAVMKEIAELLDPKPREKIGKASGKSSAPAKLVLSTEQLRLKKLFGDLIESFVDGSDDQTPIRLVVEPKDKKIKPDDLAMALCAHTSLEGNVKANFVCVDRTGTPRPSNIMDWLGQWCEYRVDTVRRRLTDQKARLDHRLHILAGRLSILDKIDEVIQVIKVSEDAKADLMSKYKLSEIQAEDVLEMRLRSLANLEKHKLEDEQKEKALESERLGKLLADDKAVRKLIMKELDADAKAFGDARRTELAPAEASNSKAASAPLALSERLGPEPMAVALTERGWLAWRPAKSLEEARVADFKIKGGDSIRRIYFGDRNSDCLVLINEKGRGYSLRLGDLSKADTDPLTKWFELDGRIIEGAIANNDSQFVLAGQEGYGFIVKGSSWINRMRAGKDLLTVGPSAPPLPPLPLPAGLSAATRMVALASDGRAVVFPLSDMKSLAKGKGVAIMGLAPGVHLADIALVPEASKLVLASTKKNVNLAPDHFDSYTGTRSAGKKGKSLDKLSAGAVFDRPGREGALDAPASE